MRFTVRIPIGPDGFQMAISMWCFSLAAGFLLSPETAFTKSAYIVTILMAWPVPYIGWGVFFLVYSLASTACLFVGKNNGRAALGFFGILFWLWMGGSLLDGSIHNGYVSIAGVFCCLLGIGSGVSVIQLGHRRLGELNYDGSGSGSSYGDWCC